MSTIEDDVKDIIKGEEKQSDLTKATELLFNDKWKRRKTILKPRQISALSNIDIIGQIYDVQFLLDWYDSYTEHLTSSGGQGRKDIVDITKFSIDRQNTRDKQMLEVLGKR